jgi:hypothetical protein
LSEGGPPSEGGLLVAVGTFLHGFDALVAAADAAAAGLGIAGFAQIGGSRVVPRHLLWARTLPPAELAARIGSARVVVCHGGVGILGEAMRAGRPIVAVPRRGPTTAGHPAGDQLPFLERLAGRFPIRLCVDPAALAAELAAALAGPATIAYPLGSDVPDLLARFLAGQGVGGGAGRGVRPQPGRPAGERARRQT